MQIKILDIKEIEFKMNLATLRKKSISKFRYLITARTTLKNRLMMSLSR